MSTTPATQQQMTTVRHAHVYAMLWHSIYILATKACSYTCLMSHQLYDINNTIYGYRYNTELNTNGWHRPIISTAVPHACTQLQPCLHCCHSSSTCCHNVTLVSDMVLYKLHESLPRAWHVVAVACSVGRLHRTALLHFSVNVPISLPQWLKEDGTEDVVYHRPQGSSHLVLHGELQYETQYRNKTY